MIHFRIRDYFSVLFYRLIQFAFGSFGRGVRVVSPMRIWGARSVHLADNVTLSTGAYLAVVPPRGGTAALRIGRRTAVGNHVHIVVINSVEIGESVLIADRVFITDSGHDYRDPDLPIIDQPLRQLGDTRIGDGSWIGENVCIIGCAIGRNCVVGANSVVTRDVPDYCVVAGSPARIIKRWDPDTRSWGR